MIITYCYHVILLCLQCIIQIVREKMRALQLALPSCTTLVSQPYFGVNLTRISFFLSEDITDSILESLTEYNKNVQQICLVECDRITDKVLTRTIRQCRRSIRCLENNYFNSKERVILLLSKPLKRHQRFYCQNTFFSVSSTMKDGQKTEKRR